ncbi:MAG: photosystem I reaction center subunit PsaK [Scytonematopsis contorta HA4267-MV1]|nr:photosystem I reaction center subunit PsaK [Scytonematopsis contorta HA4267-MV1]
MLTSTLLATATAPLAWTPVVGAIMVICNIIAIAFGKSTIKLPNVGPAMPSPNFFGGFSAGSVLATAAFGHILGVGVILGLHNLGRI